MIDIERFYVLKYEEAFVTKGKGLTWKVKEAVKFKNIEEATCWRDNSYSTNVIIVKYSVINMTAIVG